MQAIKTKGDLYHVRSTPGDSTLYDFYLLILGEFAYCFSETNDIAYPNRIPLFGVEPSVADRNFSDRMLGLAKQYNVNVNTLNQVMKAIELCI